MYTMLQTCEMVGMNYETLKYYCNQGLVPNVKRDRNNRRVFDDRDVAWIKSLSCLKNCGMSIEMMREYLALCLQGRPSIPTRQQMLLGQREQLVERMKQLQESIDFIDWKYQHYEDIRTGKIEYVSNLIPPDDDALATPME